MKEGTKPGSGDRNCFCFSFQCQLLNQFSYSGQCCFSVLNSFEVTRVRIGAFLTPCLTFQAPISFVFIFNNKTSKDAYLQLSLELLQDTSLSGLKYLLKRHVLQCCRNSLVVKADSQVIPVKISPSSREVLLLHDEYLIVFPRLQRSQFCQKFTIVLENYIHCCLEF